MCPLLSSRGCDSRVPARPGRRQATRPQSLCWRAHQGIPAWLPCRRAVGGWTPLKCPVLTGRLAFWGGHVLRHLHPGQRHVDSFETAVPVTVPISARRAVPPEPHALRRAVSLTQPWAPHSEAAWRGGEGAVSSYPPPSLVPRDLQPYPVPAGVRPPRPPAWGSGTWEQ